MFQPLDGPSVQTTLSVNTTTVQEIKVGATRLLDRNVITIQATTGKAYVYFGDSSLPAPSAATMIAHGIIIFKNALMSYEATDRQPVYILSVSGTVAVKVVERA